MFNTFIFTPLYNFLVFLVSVIPGHFMWIAVFVLTIIVKIILVPMYKKQVRDQVVMSHVAPKIKAIQEKYKDKKPEEKVDMGREVMDIYKEYKVSPFGTILLLIIQLPILFALYKIFLQNIDTHYSSLYSFVSVPEYINNFFLTINLAEKSILIGILAVVSQFIANHFLFAKKPDASAGEFAQSMHTQMKYMFPIIIGAVSFFTPAVISLYIIVGNVFAIWQEVYVKRPLEEKLKLELK